MTYKLKNEQESGVELSTKRECIREKSISLRGTKMTKRMAYLGNDMDFNIAKGRGLEG